MGSGALGANTADNNTAVGSNCLAGTQLELVMLLLVMT